MQPTTFVQQSVILAKTSMLQMVNASAALVLNTDLLMVFAARLLTTVKTENISLPMEPVLLLMIFARPSKDLVEDVQHAVSVINSIATTNV